MTDEPDLPDSVAFQGRQAFDDALRAQVEAAAQLPAAPVPRGLIWVDADFAEWGLDSPALMAGLSQFLRGSGRRLRMIAANWDVMPRRHPRFTAWRRDFAHVVEPFVTVEPVTLRPLALGPDSLIDVADTVYWRGLVMRAAASRAAVRPMIGQWLQASEPGWPATTLGL
ncbi:MAG: hypothetical protein ACKVQR_16500 [Aquabacterium sp.]